MSKNHPLALSIITLLAAGTTAAAKADAVSHPASLATVDSPASPIAATPKRRSVQR